jgi:hypothetical protein
MSRIEDELLESVFYLYPSRVDAENGAPKGGTGFFVNIPSNVLGRPHVYAVTNKHNIGACRDEAVLRTSSAKGQVQFFETEPHEWHICPNHDLAVFPMHPDESAIVRCVAIGLFVDHDFVEEYDVGPGDDIFMLGRFVLHDGKKRNLPSARFGNLSMMPASIPHPHYGAQDSFAVEMRSISGYSGSPVFIFWDHFSGSRGGKKRLMTQSCLALVGVDWGHIEHKLPVMLAPGRKHPDGLYVCSHSSMSGVVPAWHLAEFLDMPRFKEQRAADEQAALDRATEEPASVALDAAHDEDEWRDPDEVAQLRDEMLRRTLNTPPMPRKR